MAKANGLIEKLNALVNLTPDEIANRIGDPFAQWRPCSSLTLEEWESYRDTKIVILHNTRKPSQCEKSHKIGAKPGDSRYHAWNPANFRRLGDFSFRSKFSWENNPDEELPSCQRY